MSNRQESRLRGGQGLTDIEIDTIGEILNISMGASATAVSILLSETVSITTPKVRVMEAGAVEYQSLGPAMGIEIEYIDGLHGSNIMIMSIRDIRRIVGLLIPDEAQEDDGPLDEMHTSALGEIMNQMMGASCTALASMLEMGINISTPKTFDLDDMGATLADANESRTIVGISFRLQVDGLLDSEFMTVMPIAFAKELVEIATDRGGAATPEDKLAAPEYMPAAQVGSTGHAQVPGVIYSDDLQKPPQKNTSAQPEVLAQRAIPAREMVSAREVNSVSAGKKSVVNVAPLSLGRLDDEGESGIPIDLGLVMDVELTVTVEIGRKRKQLKEVLELRQGSIIELDKQAGEPVDVMVNGQLIARGDVVVIDDNFGVRITEIVRRGK